MIGSDRLGVTAEVLRIELISIKVNPGLEPETSSRLTLTQPLLLTTGFPHKKNHYVTNIIVFSSSSSEYSDWVADQPGVPLEPPKRSKRKPARQT